MSRERSQAPRARSTGGKQSGSLFVGIVIGLFLGIAISLAVVYMVNRKLIASAESPASAPVAAVPNGLPKPGANGVADASNAPPVAASEKPKFDFFEILPGKNGGEAPASGATADQGKTGNAGNTAQQTAETPASQAKPARVLFQAGSFQDQNDAESLKAKLALSGVEASVKPKDIPGKGVWYRVMLGPYAKAEDADKVKGVLQQNGITPTVIKLKPEGN